MNADYSKRDYLLPNGCKDLIDVITLQRLGTANALTPPGQPTELMVSNPISVGQLAALLGQEQTRILADLMQLGVFASVDQLLNFDTVCKVAQNYGFSAKLPKKDAGWTSYDPTKEY
jgi:hypothetical protein